VVSSTPRPHFTPGEDPVPIVQEAGWAPGPVWTGKKSRPHRDSIPGPSSPLSVAIPTELPGPPNMVILTAKSDGKVPWAQYYMINWVLKCHDNEPLHPPKHSIVK
jgi:hypothetical protein